MANAPASGSSPRIAGTASGTIPAATLNQATSYRLRPTGTRQSAVTLSRDRARLTQNVVPAASTRQMSDEIPPVSGISLTSWSALTSAIRTSAP